MDPYDPYRGFEPRPSCEDRGKEKKEVVEETQDIMAMNPCGSRE